MPFQKGKSDNPKGRPKKGDSLAECVRSQWDKAKRRKAIDAMAAKAEAGDVQAYSALAKTGFPEESKGVSLDINSDGPITVQIIDAGA